MKINRLRSMLLAADDAILKNKGGRKEGAGDDMAGRLEAAYQMPAAKVVNLDPQEGSMVPS